MEGTYRARCGEKVPSFHALSTQVSLFSNPEALQTPSFWILRRLCYLGMID